MPRKGGTTRWQKHGVPLLKRPRVNREFSRRKKEADGGYGGTKYYFGKSAMQKRAKIKRAVIRNENTATRASIRRRRR